MRFQSLAVFLPISLVLVVGATPQDPSDDLPEAPEIEVPYGARPFPGILTAGQPSPEDFEALAAAGYRTVINLRTAGERGTWDEAAKARELGIAYLHLPVAGAEGLTEANTRAFSEALEDPALYPMVVHCGSSNRVGALFALKAYLVDGVQAEEALEIGKKAGLRGLEDEVRALLGP